MTREELEALLREAAVGASNPEVLDSLLQEILKARKAWRQEGLEAAAKHVRSRATHGNDVVVAFAEDLARAISRLPVS